VSFACIRCFMILFSACIWSTFEYFSLRALISSYYCYSCCSATLSLLSVYFPLLFSISASFCFNSSTYLRSTLIKTRSMSLSDRFLYIDSRANWFVGWPFIF
jgi:hypothetical protein